MSEASPQVHELRRRRRSEELRKYEAGEWVLLLRPHPMPRIREFSSLAMNTATTERSSCGFVRPSSCGGNDSRGVVDKDLRSPATRELEAQMDDDGGGARLHEERHEGHVAEAVRGAAAAEHVALAGELEGVESLSWTGGPTRE